MRSKFLGNTNGELGSERGAPVPFDLGRPAPSWTVNLALKSWAPYWISCGMETVNSSPSCKCTGIAISRPICELGLCPKTGITMAKRDRAASQTQLRQRVLLIRPSFLFTEHFPTSKVRPVNKALQLQFTKSHGSHEIIGAALLIPEPFASDTVAVSCRHRRDHHWLLQTLAQ